MLTPEAAREALAAQQISDWSERRRRELARSARAVRQTGEALLDASTWREVTLRPQERPDPAPFLEALDPRQRTNLFETLFPSLGVHFERMWQLGMRQPYQLGWTRRAFRAPNDPSVSLPVRSQRLLWVVGAIQGYEPDVRWLARWAAFLGYGSPVTPLLTAIIEGGGKDGDDVFDILIASAEGTDEVGAMGRHVTGALLAASRQDGWEYVEKLLLAAQRQEGLRQVVLEAIDEANPTSFRRMLGTIREHNLTRFSATARAVDVWLGLAFAAGEVRRLDSVIERLLRFLDEENARAVSIRSGAAEDAYLALWAAAYEDAPTTLSAITPLLHAPEPERRYVATHLLVQIGLTTSMEALAPALEDEDLRVAARALDAFIGVEGGVPTDVFERLERLDRQIQPAKVTLPPIVWPWTGRVLERQTIGRALLANIGGRPVSRLVPHLDAMDAWTRRDVATRLGKGGSVPRDLRAVLVKLVGDPSSTVREAAIASASKLRIDDDEALELEQLLTRKAGDLRRGVTALLLARGDEAALASADRLLDSGDAQRRMGGLEILRRMLEEDRAPEAATQRADHYEGTRDSIGDAERVQLDAILRTDDSAPRVDQGLGLVDPEDFTPPLQPTDHQASLTSPAAFKILSEIDALVHGHRDDRVLLERWDGEREELLGNAGGWFPRPLVHPYLAFRRDQSGQAVADTERTSVERLPLFDTWERWRHDRSPSTRDEDGFELLRALVVPIEDRRPFAGIGHDGARNTLLSGAHAPTLRYPDVVRAVVEWLVVLDPPAGTASFLLDATETLLSRVPLRDLEVPEEEMPWNRMGWRIGGWTVYLELARLVRRLCPEEWTREGRARLWRIERWCTLPTVAQTKRRRLLRKRDDTVRSPVRPPLDEVVAAYRAGVATDTDLIDHLVGGRSTFWGYVDLRTLSGRHMRHIAYGLPKVAEIVERCRARIVEVELRRGEAPTAASGPALALRYSGGLDRLTPMLHTLGRQPFVRGWSYDGQGQGVVISHLIRTTFPAETDTPEAFADAMRAAKIPQKRIVELGTFAPQWAEHVQTTVGWPALASGIWWMHAHTKSNDWTVDQEIREAWAAEVAERTPLAASDLLDGAADVDWFHRAYEVLGPERWVVLDRAAKYCSTGGGHKRAQLFANAMRGAVGSNDLTERIRAKRHQDSVRALGLLPIAAEDDREATVLNRYSEMQEFVRTGRQFGSQRRTSERRAAEVGLDNLARTAGFADPIRLAWAMEARGIADLADGPLTVRVGDVDASLQIDDSGEPRFVVTRGGRPLKSVPTGARLSPEIKALRERTGELRKQSARVRSSLETAMIRGDTFTGAELHELAGHLLLAPRLDRLVVVGDGIAGYPTAAGRALLDHRGEQQAVGSADVVRIAHSADLLATGQWHEWQRDCLAREILQPFKQVFRELYVPTRTELDEGQSSRRYEGHQVQPRKALALLGGRGWVAHPEEGVRRVFHDARLVAYVWFLEGFGTPAEIEGLTVEQVRFGQLDERRDVDIGDVPPRIFSEVMRDLDLVVSVAHAGAVDPEASASTVEMRAALVEETANLLTLENVRIDAPWALIEGRMGEYSIHLGSGVVHRRPGGEVCIIPVHGQHRGRIFLPFADDDPKSAEVLAKVLMLARDHEIKDPTVLEQIRMQ